MQKDLLNRLNNKQLSKKEKDIEKILLKVQEHVQQIKEHKLLIKKEEHEVRLLLGKLTDQTSYVKVHKLTGIARMTAYKYKQMYYTYLKEKNREDLMNIKKTPLTDYLKKNNKIKEENIKYYE